MAEVKLGMVETRFAELIWEREPLTTRELVALCEKELGWKRTTTYTVLKKLCGRGIFAMKDSVITSLLSKEDFHALHGEQFLQEHFHGSLPAFLAAFTARKAPTPEELEQIRSLIDGFGGETR